MGMSFRFTGVSDSAEKDNLDSKVRQHLANGDEFLDLSQLNQFEENNLQDSTFEESVFQGNRDVQINNYFADKRLTNTKLEPLAPRAFPISCLSPQLLAQSDLSQAAQFLEKHHWLILEKNNDNKYFISDVIAGVLSNTNKESYFVRQGATSIREYLDKRFPFEQSQTKSVIRQSLSDLDELEQFVEARENLTALSQTLQDNQTVVIFVLDSEGDGKKAHQISNYLNMGSIFSGGYINPRIEVGDNHEKVLSENWLHNTLKLMACWFTNIPITVFEQTITLVFEAKMNSARPEGYWVGFTQDELETDFELWKRQPDLIFQAAELEISYPSEQFQGSVQLRSTGKISACRAAFLQHCPFLLKEVAGIIEGVVFDQPLDKDIDKRSELFGDLAYLYSKLSSVGIIDINAVYLREKFDQSRVLSGTESKFAHFIEWIQALKKYAHFSESIQTFIYEIHKDAMQKEQELLDNPSFSIYIKNWVPFLVNDVSSKLKVTWSDYKNRLYGVFNVLALGVGFKNKATLVYLESMLAKSLTATDKAQTSPGVVIIRHYYSGYLSSNPDNLLQVIEKLFSQDDEYFGCTTFITRLFVLSLCYRIEDPKESVKDKAQSYFIDVLMRAHHLDKLCLLLTKHKQYRVKNIQLIFNALVLIRYRIDSTFMTIDGAINGEAEVLITQLKEKSEFIMANLAATCDKQEYRLLKANLKLLCEQALNEYRSCGRDKALRALLKRRYKICKELTKQFKNKRELTHG